MALTDLISKPVYQGKPRTLYEYFLQRGVAYPPPKEAVTNPPIVDILFGNQPVTPTAITADLPGVAPGAIDQNAEEKEAARIQAEIRAHENELFRKSFKTLSPFGGELERLREIEKLGGGLLPVISNKLSPFGGDVERQKAIYETIGVPYEPLSELMKKTQEEVQKAEEEARKKAEEEERRKAEEEARKKAEEEKAEEERQKAIKEGIDVTPVNLLKEAEDRLLQPFIRSKGQTGPTADIPFLLRMTEKPAFIYPSVYGELSSELGRPVVLQSPYGFTYQTPSSALMPIVAHNIAKTAEGQYELQGRNLLADYVAKQTNNQALADLIRNVPTGVSQEILKILPTPQPLSLTMAITKSGLEALNSMQNKFIDDSTKATEEYRKYLGRMGRSVPTMDSAVESLDAQVKTKKDPISIISKIASETVGISNIDILRNLFEQQYGAYQQAVQSPNLPASFNDLSMPVPIPGRGVLPLSIPDWLIGLARKVPFLQGLVDDWIKTATDYSTQKNVEQKRQLLQKMMKLWDDLKNQMIKHYRETVGEYIVGKDDPTLPLSRYLASTLAFDMVETFSREFKPLSESDKRMILSMASTNPGQAMAILRDKVNEGLRTKVSVLRDYLPLAGQSPIYNTHFKTVVSDLSHLMDSPSLFVRSSVVTFLESQEGRLLLENSPELQQKYDATRKDLLDTFTKYGDKVRNPDDPVTQWRFEDNPKSVYSFFLGNWVGIPEALELRIATTTPLSKIPGLENYAQFKQDIKEIKEGLATIESVKDKNERKKLIKQLDAEARKYGSSYKNVKADIRRIEELEDTYYNTANDDERNKALNELMQIYQGYLQTQGTAQDITQQQKTPTPGSAGQGSGGGSTPRMSPN